VQIIAAPGQEALALRAAHWLESQRIVHAKPAS
jgi:Asp-tRNA(Asn)/Glu-tRNA(Gln) amidotransferase A subunit family amidase